MAVLSVALLSPIYLVAFAQETATQPALPEEQAPKIPNDQLDSLVAPIALYPDPLLSQTLVASTYPLEIVQLQQWMEKNENLKGKALADAVEKQPWDPSIQSMAIVPDVVKQLGDNIAWTSQLGDAFLSQESDVMDAVQRMRTKAESAGTLKTSEQQMVETQQVEGKSVVVIQPSNPEVVYVPSYNPTVVYGQPAYPYPSMYYPPYGAYAAGAALSFGVGVAVGAIWGNGGWGYGCGWGNNNVNVNVNNKYVNHYNKNNVNNKIGNNSNWKHNPQHRGGAPYPNRQTANKYGGASNRPGAANRPGGANGQSARWRKCQSARRRNGQSARWRNSQSTRRRNGQSTWRRNSQSARRRNSPATWGGTAQRPGGGTAQRPGGGTAKRPSGGGASSRPATRPASSANQMGNRQVSRSPSSSNRSAFSSSSGGMNRSSASASHSRGSRSMGGGGGGGRGGGGRRR